MKKIEEGSPIYEAIDRGGGQTCDIAGVIRELDRAGYVIVPREPTADIMTAGHRAQASTITDQPLLETWQAMIDEAQR
jgi:hypothetical protein